MNKRALGKYQAYPENKDSGVDWLGEIPTHWDTRCLKRIFNIKKHIAGKLGFDVLSVTQRGIKIKDIETGNGQLSMDYSKYQRVEIGDFAMNHMDLLTGYVDLSKFDGVTSPDYRVFKIKEDHSFDKRYYLYLLQMGYKQKLFFHLGQGSSHLGRWRLPTEAFNEIEYPIPLEIEQIQIANFLDHETAKIDTLIDKQQQLIKLLKEKRQAVISHAVTKGLNPDAPMKDSGVEWLGEVPEHWVVHSLGKITFSKCDGPFGSGLKSEHYTDAGVKVVRLQNIKMGCFREGEAVFINQDYYENNLRNHDVNSGDLLIAGLGDPRNPVGRACIAPNDIAPAMVKADCFRFRLNNKKVVSEYIAQQLSISSFHDAGKLSNGSTRARIPLSLMTSRQVAYGSLTEQEEVLKYIFIQSNQFDKLERKAESAIKLLQERRTALISAAVTGKIDVRYPVSPPTGNAENEHLEPTI